MPSFAAIQEQAFSSRAKLLALEQLVRHGVNAYEPVSAVDGVDALVRRVDGRYIDLVVRPSINEHFPLHFQSPELAPRDSLFVVCVAWALSPLQFWILPSAEFVRRASPVGDGWLDLDLESLDASAGQKHKVALGFYRNAWRLIVDGAVKSLVAY